MNYSWLVFYNTFLNFKKKCLIVAYTLQILSVYLNEYLHI